MDFHLTDKQCDLRDEFRAYFDKLMTPELVAELNQTTGEGGGPLYQAAMKKMGDDGCQRKNIGKEIHKHHNEVENQQPQKYVKRIKDLLNLCKL